MRICSICKQSKPLDQFSPTSARYLSCRCKSCAADEQHRRRRARGVPEKRRRSKIGTGENGFICLVCGELRPADEFKLRRGRKTRDFRCRRCEAIRNRQAQRTPSGQLAAARTVAKRRGIPWLLTKDEYAALRALPCAYCGWPLPQTSTGLDRKDGTLGYVAGNVVPCCTECNIAKGSIFTYEEMLILGRAVAEVKARREQSGQPQHSCERGWGRPRKYQDAE